MKNVTGYNSRFSKTFHSSIWEIADIKGITSPLLYIGEMAESKNRLAITLITYKSLIQF